MREFSFGLERMDNVLWMLLALWCVAAVGETVYLIAASLYTAAELMAAALELAAFALAIVQQIKQKAVLASCIRRAEPVKKNKEQ